jgi:hypothetical protein
MKWYMVSTKRHVVADCMVDVLHLGEVGFASLQDQTLALPENPSPKQLTKKFEDQLKKAEARSRNGYQRANPYEDSLMPAYEPGHRMRDPG